MAANPTSVLDDLAAQQEAVRVILVEDDPAFAGLVVELLAEGGDSLIVHSCTTLGQAEGPIGAGLADLVLLDLHLPDASDLDGLARLRKMAPDVPVVVLTAAEGKRLPVLAMQAGAQDFLRKDGVTPASLSKAIRFAVERQRSERRLVRLAMRDPLTGLPNRVLFADRLEQTMARALRRGPGQLTGQGGLVVMMLVDVDGFSAVNAATGHPVGDRLLVELSDRLRTALREGDTLARLGGDEFVILCEDVLDDASALRLGERLAGRAAVPSDIEPGQTLSVSVGLAVADPATEGGGDLLLRADVAVQAAKRIGPGRCALADPAGSVR